MTQGYVVTLNQGHIKVTVHTLPKLMFGPSHYAPFEKGGHIALHMSVCQSVGMSVSLNLVQLITQEHSAPEASNLVGR